MTTGTEEAIAKTFTAEVYVAGKNRTALLIAPDAVEALRYLADLVSRDLTGHVHFIRFAVCDCDTPALPG